MRFGLVLVILLVVGGCGYKTVDADEMILSMEEIRSDPKTIVNRLWYQGHDDEFHYFSYVYGMLQQEKYRIPVDKLDIPDAVRFSDENYIAVNRIGDRWQGAGYNSSLEEWIPLDEGIVMEPR